MVQAKAIDPIRMQTMPYQTMVRSANCISGLVFLAMVLVPGAPAGAQETRPGSDSSTIGGRDPATNLPVLNRPFPLFPATTPAKPEPPPPSPDSHAFWDATNRMLFAGVGVFRALDYASTRNMQARGREEILLPDDVVNNSAGFAAVEAGASAASVGLSYLMHRTGHHRMERWISIVHIGVTGFGVVRNYSLESKHPMARR